MMCSVAVDDDLLDRAQKLTGSTREEAVETALREFVDRHEQMKIRELFGTIEYDPTYDYKLQRRHQ